MASPGFPGDLGGPNDDGVVHVPPVERVGVAEHEAAPAGVDEPEAGLEPRPPFDFHGHALFHVEYPGGDSRLKIWVFYYRPCQLLLVSGLVLGWSAMSMARWAP